MTKRDRVTVNLLPSDAEWLRCQAEDYGVTLSEALQTLVGAARVREEMEAHKQAQKFTRERRRDERAMARLALEARQLELFASTDLQGNTVH